MNRNKQKNFITKVFSRSTTMLLVVFLFSQFLPSIAAADFKVENAKASKYIIKLDSEKDLATLKNIGGSVLPIFSFSNNPVFKNIYTFLSHRPLPVLKNILVGHYQYLEVDENFETSAILVNDPGYTTDPLDIDRQWGLAKAGFGSAWEKTTGSAANVVAVIDTGIDATHEDLKTINYTAGFNFLTHQEITPQTNSDDNGHGTLVAGVLGATPNNGKGIVGTNWQISLMPLKALDSAGKGDSATVSEAIVWAADHSANLINLSIGGIGFAHDITLANSISYAFKKNIVIVAAAGNDVSSIGSNLDTQPVYPICDDNNENMIIGVAASDQNDLKANFSNYGKNCIDVSAPGKRILSTINYDPATKTYSPNSYAYASGTSLAVPYVVGEAALLRAFYPWATNVQIRDWIISTTDPIDGLNPVQCVGPCNGLLGSGRISVVKSIEKQIASSQLSEGDLVKTNDTQTLYQISGGQKRLVSSFVLLQRFPGLIPKSVFPEQLANIPAGPYVTPLEGTLFKLESAPTIYMMQQGQKRPITNQVFKHRRLGYSDVDILSSDEINSWLTGPFLAPGEGTMVRTPKSRTLYWVISGVLHPVNYKFYFDRGLEGFPVLVVPEKDLPSYPRGEAYSL